MTVENLSVYVRVQQENALGYPHVAQAGLKP